MTQYLITYEKYRGNESETWHDQRPSYQREVDPLVAKAERLEREAWDRLCEFWERVERGEYGDDPDGAAYCEARDRYSNEYMLALERMYIIRERQTCDCVDRHCAVCDAYFYVTNAEEI